MRNRRAIAASARPSGGWRRVLVALALLAFALQGYITQTHIHFAASRDFGLSADDFTPAAKHVTGSKAPGQRAPGNDDPANCPICQAVLHSGQFVSPSAVVFSLPSEAVAIVPLAIAIAIPRVAVSHNWQGRAPPR